MKKQQDQKELLEKVPSKYVKKWEYNGLECLILINPFGGLNGYVGVPKNHIAFDKQYDDLPINVHGGLTFGSMGKKGSGWENEKLMYFGFDTLHCGDYAPDLQSDKDGHRWTLEEVARETEDMAKQFSELTIGKIIERKIKYEPDWFKDNIINKQFLSEKIEKLDIGEILKECSDVLPHYKNYLIDAKRLDFDVVKVKGDFTIYDSLFRKYIKKSFGIEGVK